MKNKNSVLVFKLLAFVFVFFTACENPIMRKWWEEPEPQIITREAVPPQTVYTVEFDMSGGDYVDSTPNGSGDFDNHAVTQRVVPGSKVADPGLVKKSGEFLAGWYTQGGKPWNFYEDTVTADKVGIAGKMILKAEWYTSGWTVTFNCNYSSAPGLSSGDLSYEPVVENIASGARAAEPLEFVIKNANSGYTFHGWYEDSNCANPWDFNTDRVTANITLYAGWTALPPNHDVPADVGYVVQWYVGNAYNSPMPQLLKEGAKIAAPAIITNPGHGLAGWYTDRAFTQEWDFSVDTMSANRSNAVDFKKRRIITLYAKWVVPDMVFVQSGSYTMGGAGYANTAPYPTVNISGFYISPSETPNWKYKEVMGNIPSHWTGDYNPVEQVTWYDAVNFCNELSKKEGLIPYYNISNIVTGTYSGKTFIKSANVTVAVDTAGVFNDGYRLPTEAEWEYAARDGNGAPNNYTYAGSDNVDEVAWYDTNSASSTHPVKTKKSNQLGLYDMSGNVSEWCWDWYDSTYYKNYVGVTDPINSNVSSKTPPERVRRGGNWNMLDVKTRSRTNTNPGTFSYVPSDDDLKRFWTIGFRTVRSLRPTY